MEKARREHVIGIPVSNRAFGIEEPDFPSKAKGDAYHGGARNPAATAARAGKFGRNGDRVAQGLKAHGEFAISNQFWIWMGMAPFILRHLFPAHGFSSERVPA
jgi:hypothetical protein